MTNGQMDKHILTENTALMHRTAMCKSYKRTGSDGAMDWLVLVAEGRLPQRAMLWMLAIQPSFAIMSLPMLRCFIFHLRFSRSSI